MHQPLYKLNADDVDDPGNRVASVNDMRDMFEHYLAPDRPPTLRADPRFVRMYSIPERPIRRTNSGASAVYPSMTFVRVWISLTAFWAALLSLVSLVSTGLLISTLAGHIVTEFGAVELLIVAATSALLAVESCAASYLLSQKQLNLMPTRSAKGGIYLARSEIRP
ncbi:MAG: hypothetical protein ABFE08_14775 [Armatimonadia bacterium]